ncbi:MAG TPA: phage tail tip lysozyme [Candidatus Saccharimonadales bacterium]|nr:phage tail tip lysozyme [Candidatus Saccharimonadales bacterium]
MIRPLKRLSARLQHIRWAAWITLPVMLYAATGPTYALTQNDLYTEGINYFDLNVSQCGANGSDATGGNGNSASGYIATAPQGSTNPDKIWYFLTQEVHMTPAAAAGIMGNLNQESGMDPTSEQRPGAWEDMSSRNINEGGKGGVGIVQWDGGRRPAYINYALQHGADKKNIVPQLNYLWYEMNHDQNAVLKGGDWKGVHYPGLTGIKDPHQAAVSFHALYERSGDSASGIEERARDAVKYYAKYTGDGSFNTTVGGTAPATCTGGTVGTVNGTNCASIGKTSEANDPKTNPYICVNTEVKCAAGTDAGIGKGYNHRKEYDIRLCKVDGVTVNAFVATNIDQMVKAAKGAHLNMTGSGFRTMESQIELRSKNGCGTTHYDIYERPSSECRVPTARPGESNHQMGLAVDWDMVGGLFSWMSKNAATYGFKNFPAENWHWSVDGK